MAEKLITPEFRGWFAHLNKPKAMKGEPDSVPRYQIMCVLPEDDTWWDEAEDAIDAVAKEKWGSIPKKLKRPIKLGEEEEEYEDLAGMMFFNASNDRRPGIVDSELQDILDPEELYSGAHYRISVNVYAWEHPTGGKGVSFGLNNVMKTKDGERLDGGTSAQKDFEGFAEKPKPNSRRRRGGDEDGDSGSGRRGKRRGSSSMLD